MTRLRRAACDPRLVAPELGLIGAKVLEFERLALELVAGRHKALVFSQFTDFLALLRERLDLAGLRYQYLDGSTPAAERSKRVAAFQAGAGRPVPDQPEGRRLRPEPDAGRLRDHCRPVVEPGQPKSRPARAPTASASSGR